MNTVLTHPLAFVSTTCSSKSRVYFILVTIDMRVNVQNTHLQCTFAWPFNYFQAFAVIHCANIRLFFLPAFCSIHKARWRDRRRQVVEARVRAKRIWIVYLPSWIDSVICFIFSHIFSWNHKTNKQLKTDSRFHLTAAALMIATLIRFSIRALLPLFSLVFALKIWYTAIQNCNDKQTLPALQCTWNIYRNANRFKAPCDSDIGIAKPCANKKCSNEEARTISRRAADEWMWISNERLLSICASHIESVNENRAS